MTPVLLFALASALAQDPTYDGTEAPAEAVEKPETTLVADLGGVFTAGNAYVISLNGGIVGGHKWGHNRIGFNLGTSLSWARTDYNGNGTIDGFTIDTDGDGFADAAEQPDGGGGTVVDSERELSPLPTSQRVQGGVRYDRFFGPARRNSLYISANGEHDRFAGLVWRFNQQIGYSRLLVDTEATQMNLELGAAITQEDFVEGADGSNAASPDSIYPAVRVFWGFSHIFNDHVSMGDSLELFENLSAKEDEYSFGGDFRGVNEIWIAAKVSDRFSVKLSDRIAWDTAPVPTFRPWDNTVSISLVATLL